MKLVIKASSLLFYLMLINLTVFSQDQRIANELIHVYESYHEDLNTDSLQSLLWNIAFNCSNPEEKITYASHLVELAGKSESQSPLFNGYYQIGDGLRKIGNLDSALAVFIKCLKIAQANNFLKDEGDAQLEIGNIYSILGNHSSSVDYYKKAIKSLQGIDVLSLASAKMNLGDEYFSVGEYDSALVFFIEARSLFESEQYESGIAYSLGNIGLVYAEEGSSLDAEMNIQVAVDMLEEMGDFYGISVYLTYMADIYKEKDDLRSALKYASTSLQLATSHGLKEQIRDASLKLSELFELQGNLDSAYHYHKQYVAFRDSINNEETIQEIADLRTEYEVGQKQAEVDVLTAQQRTERVIMAAIAALAVVLLILGLIVYKYYKQKSRVNQELERLNQTKDKFFSIISHDLRGPVSSFMGISRMIKFLVKSKETDQLLEVADDIDESVDRLSALLDNLLNWAMQQQGHFPNVPEKVNLEELAEDLVKTLHTMAKSKQITLEHSVSSEINLWVDRNTTMTIFRNLVNNALKFTPEGGQVSIEAHESNGMAKVCVSDTGVGISSDKLEKLFQLEDKKSTYGTSGERGLGLGLQLVYEFVEMNQGSLKVESEEGKGTVFTVSLPLYDTEEELTRTSSKSL